MARTQVPEEGQRVEKVTGSGDTLKNIKPRPKAVIRTEGYDLSNDGLANLYWWDPSGNPSNADGTTIIKSNVSGYQNGQANEGVWRRMFTPPTELPSGSSGAVQYTDGNGNFVGNASYLYVDNSNGRVGIGTDSPSTQLDVQGGVSIQDFTFDQSSGDLVLTDDSGVELIRQPKAGPTEFIQGISLGTIEAPEDSLTQVVNVSSTAAASSGDPVGYTFAVDNQSLLEVSAEADGSGGIQNASVDFNSSISGLDTDDIPEGSNEYFTDERAQDAVGTIITGSGATTVNYDDANDTITVSSTNTTYSAGDGLSLNNGSFNVRLNVFEDGGTAFTNSAYEFDFTGNLTASGSNRVTVGLDQGDGSGLDADTLDGIEGSNYARTDITETFNADVYFTGGNVGIGTSSPDALLDIEGSAGANNSYIDINTDGSGRPIVFYENGTERGAVNYNFASNGFSFDVVDSSNNKKLDALFIAGEQDNTQVGINTTSPAGVLDVSSGDFIVTSSGNVGIGTTSPSYKLDVNGDINAQGELRSSGNIVSPDNDSDAHHTRPSAGDGLEDSSNTFNVRLDVFEGGGTAFTNSAYQFDFTGNLTASGTSRVTVGLDQGSGSGLNADLLDGVEGSNYARTDVAETFNANISLNGNDINNVGTITSISTSFGELVIDDFTFDQDSDDLVLSDNNGVELIRQPKGGSTQFVQGAEIGSIEAPGDSFTQIVNAPSTSAASSGDLVGYTFAVDNQSLFEIRAESDGVGGIQNGQVHFNRNLRIGSNKAYFTPNLALSEASTDGNLKIGDGSGGYAEVEAQDYYVNEDNVWLGDHIGDSDAHHTRPSAGDGLSDNSNTFNVGLNVFEGGGTAFTSSAYEFDFTGNLTASGTNRVSVGISQGSGSGLDADTLDGVELANIDFSDIAATRYTDEEAQDAVGTITSGGSDINVNYDDANDSLTISHSVNGASSDSTSDTFVETISVNGNGHVTSITTSAVDSTSSQTLLLDSSSANSVLLKSVADELQIRNQGDSAYRDLRVRDLVVEGTETIINTETIEVSDNKILLNSNVSGSPTEDAGIEVERGDSTNARLFWNESSDYWMAGLSGSEVQLANVNENLSTFNNDLTTNDIDEPSSPSSSDNLYFTDERAQDAVGTIMTGSGATTVTYDDANDTITISSSDSDTTYSAGDGLALNNGTFDVRLNVFEGGGTAFTNSAYEFDFTGNLTASGSSRVSVGIDQGSGSGLDADLLDGVEGSNYARTDIAETFNDEVYFTGGNVGIGTDSPSFALDTVGTINTDTAYNFSGSGPLLIGKDHGASVGDESVAIGKGARTLEDTGGTIANNHPRSTVVGFEAGNNTGSGVFGLSAFGYEAARDNTGDRVTANGYGAAQNNTGNRVTASGYRAARSNTGNRVTASGYYAARYNSQDDNVAIGQFAMRADTLNANSNLNLMGARSVAVGNSALRDNQGDNSVGLGYQAGQSNTGNDSVLIGREAGKNNSSDNQFIVQQANVNTTPLIQGDFATGNVGIGTTSPGYKLDVTGTVHASRLNLENEESADNDGDIIRDNSVGFIGRWGGNAQAVLWDAQNVSTGSSLTVNGGTGNEGQPTITHATGSNGTSKFTSGSTVIDDIDIDGDGHVTNINTESRSLDDWNAANADLNIGNNNLDNVNTLNVRTVTSNNGDAHIDWTQPVHFNNSGGNNESYVTRFSKNGASKPAILTEDIQIDDFTFDQDSGDLVLTDDSGVELIRQPKAGPTEFIQGISLGAIEAPEDSFTQILNASSTSAATSGDIVGYTLSIDNQSVLEVKADADGSGGITNKRIEFPSDTEFAGAGEGLVSNNGDLDVRLPIEDGGGFVTDAYQFNFGGALDALDDGSNQVTIRHTDTSSQGDVSTGGSTIIDDIDLDGYGHITNINTQNRSLDDWNAANADLNLDGNGLDNVGYIDLNTGEGMRIYGTDLSGTNGNDDRVFRIEDANSPSSPDGALVFTSGDDDKKLQEWHDGGVKMWQDLNMGGNQITNVGDVDGVDISAHASNDDAHHPDHRDGINHISFNNTEGTGGANGDLSYDNSEGLLFYRTFQPGNVHSGDDYYSVLAASNISEGDGIAISGGKGSGGSPVRFDARIDVDDSGANVTNAYSFNFGNQLDVLDDGGNQVTINVEDGGGSGLDADTVDGIQGESIMHGDPNNTLGSGSDFNNLFGSIGNPTPTLESMKDSSQAANMPSGAYTYGTVWTGDARNSSIQIYGPHNASNQGANHHLWFRTYWKGDGNGPEEWSKIWTEADMGSGSGLDADELDGTDLADIYWTIEEGDGEQTNVYYSQKLEIYGGGGLNTEITSSGTESRLRVSHNNTSSQGNVSTGGATVIDDIGVDGYGHVTNMNTQNRSLDDWNTANSDIDLGGNNIDNVGNLNVSSIDSNNGGNPVQVNQGLDMNSNAVTFGNFDVEYNSNSESLDFIYKG